MKRKDLARQLAAETRTSPAEAADRLDRMVHGIIRKLKRGKRTTVPGLGVLAPGKCKTNPNKEGA